jgi:hypothetical protein
MAVDFGGEEWVFAIGCPNNISKKWRQHRDVSAGFHCKPGQVGFHPG